MRVEELGKLVWRCLAVRHHVTQVPQVSSNAEKPLKDRSYQNQIILDIDIRYNIVGNRGDLAVRSKNAQNSATPGGAGARENARRLDHPSGNYPCLP